MDSQDGKTLLSVLIVALALVGIMWLAVPWLQKSTLSGDEASAVSTLRMIDAAQREYFGATRMYASLGKLSNSELTANAIREDNFKLKGYEFFHSTTGSGSTWCAVAVPQMKPDATSIGTPERQTGKVFGIDESGVVYQDVQPSACYAGTLNTAGGSPVK